MLYKQKQVRAILYCVDWNEKGLAFYRKFGMMQKGHVFAVKMI